MTREAKTEPPLPFGPLWVGQPILELIRCGCPTRKGSWDRGGPLIPRSFGGLAPSDSGARIRRTSGEVLTRRQPAKDHTIRPF